MKELLITDREAGQRLDRFLHKYFSAAGSSFVYKMLRKKNITVNEKKAAGSDILHSGDVLRLWFSEETLEKLTGQEASPSGMLPKAKGILAGRIMYEDAHVLLIDKPAGLLTQKAGPKDHSLVEEVTAYLLESGQLKADDLALFHPACANRLDRNTSGLVAAGKTTAGLQALSSLIADRRAEKYYRCIVEGTITEGRRLEDYLVKDDRRNMVSVSKRHDKEARDIVTVYTPVLWGRDLRTNQPLTMLEVQLITGRPHQIRAHLASIGHPILGDRKYGNPNSLAGKSAKRQLLHCCRMTFPVLEGALAGLSEKSVTAPLPEDFAIARWQPSGNTH